MKTWSEHKKDMLEQDKRSWWTAALISLAIVSISIALIVIL